MTRCGFSDHKLCNNFNWSTKFFKETNLAQHYIFITSIQNLVWFLISLYSLYWILRIHAKNKWNYVYFENYNDHFKHFSLSITEWQFFAVRKVLKNELDVSDKKKENFKQVFALISPNKSIY